MTRAEIMRLSVAERIQLAEDIWDSISDSPDQVPVTDAQRRELDRRLEEYRANPVPGTPWQEVRARLQGD